MCGIFGVCVFGWWEPGILSTMAASHAFRCSIALRLDAVCQNRACMSFSVSLWVGPIVEYRMHARSRVLIWRWKLCFHQNRQQGKAVASSSPTSFKEATHLPALQCWKMAAAIQACSTSCRNSILTCFLNLLSHVRMRWIDPQNCRCRLRKEESD